MTLTIYMFIYKTVDKILSYHHEGFYVYVSSYARITSSPLIGILSDLASTL